MGVGWPVFGTASVTVGLSTGMTVPNFHERDMPTMADSTPKFINRFLAEIFGTFVLVFSVIGAALFATRMADGGMYAGAGIVGVALALGLGVLIAAYTVGGISGGHFNPAVTIGLAVAGRASWKDVPGYIVAQIIGGAVASSLLFIIASNGQPGLLDYLVQGGFASNGYDAASPLQFGLIAVVIAEVVATAILVWVILGVTEKDAPAGFAPIAIGFALVVLNIVVVPISGASFNPARSIATAIYGGATPLSQLWVFIVAPIVGGIIAAVSYPMFGRGKKA